MSPTMNPAPSPARGTYADGYGEVARVFAASLGSADGASGEEIGAAFCVERDGARVVDLYGGFADTATQTPWEGDTRLVVFSVTKGFAAMALHLLADRGLLAWDEPVATYWPGFGRVGKARVTVRTLVNHRAGLAALDTPFTLDDCLDPSRRDAVVSAMERQEPRWEPGESQGYHALTWGLYVGELFERIAKEPIGAFLERELFGRIGSDARLGAPADLDSKVATLYPPSNKDRLRNVFKIMVLTPQSAEARVGRAFFARRSLVRAAFGNPSPGPDGLRAYNDIPVRRGCLPWGSATSSARGVARAYAPFASGGLFAGERLFKERVVATAHARQGWSERDRVLQKALGWSQGFLKEERGVFGPTPEAFGHSGLGGALGWCDPVHGLSIGYVMNRLDWRVRSPRALALCKALYECEALRGS
jgi:CubicO group peptidase (beta-lactamase class C family)